MLSWEKPLVKPMPPALFPSYKFTIYFTLQSLLSIYIIKIPKFILLLSSLSDLILPSGREGIGNPFIALVARFLFVCVGTRDLHVASYWIDTLVLKNWGKYLRYSAASSLSLRGKPMQAQDVARRISGAVAGESTHKSRHTKYPSQTLIPRITLFAICLSFSSPPLHPCRFIPPLFPFPFSFLVRLFLLVSCLLVCWIACLSLWIKIILNCVIFQYQQ